MTRLFRLPENQLTVVIDGITEDIKNLKKVQTVGSDSVVTYFNQTANTWDVNGTVISGSALFAQWKVTFTPDHTPHAFAKISTLEFIDPPGDFNIFENHADPASAEDSETSYIVQFDNPNLSDVNAYIKFYFVSVDTGTITWSQIA